MIVYGSRISYYTGKLEAYLRYKNIAYTPLPTPYGEAKMLKEKVGAVQMPIVDDDGQWMSDTTPIIMHLETEHPDNPVLPKDPVVGFISHLIEDYGDEWLWRSAMYYRWWYRYDRQHASNVLTDEVMGHIKLPRWVKLKMIVRRQVNHYVKRDGVTETTRHHIEQSYHNALAALTAMLENRPFLLGNAPSLADFGMMGPMFRHYGQDPTPQEIMRNTAPAVFEWVARMWRAKNQVQPEFVAQVPEDAAPLLKEICETHLVQLTANAEAFTDNKERFDMTVQGCDYRDIAVSQYRVWCLEELRRRFDLLSADQQKSVKALLPHGEAEVLWNAKPVAQSGFNSDNHLPFGKALNVFKGGVP
ncbi:glutathione S-transferase family protein [Parasphingorhabdus sp.]|uniref:glutathione S-transferase family protein n=1 Tax=Parasphingorhabdus sp. TaxID=2709688 RepID=UPI003265FE79